LLKAAYVDFDTSKARYLAARSAEKSAAANEMAEQKNVDAADLVFDEAFRRWAPTVRDSEGKAIPQAVATLLGGVLPGKLVRMRAREELTRTADLFDQVSRDPSLGGDPSRLETLRLSRAPLAVAVEAQELADAAWSAARAELAAAEVAFDVAWGTVVREMKKAPAPIAALVPHFVRAQVLSSANASAETILDGQTPLAEETA
jgi:hypothetical protein